MNAITLKALKASIVHWERMATGGIYGADRPGNRTCALCARFFKYDCEKCPVKLRTGYTGCANTPYVAAHEAWLANNDENFKRLARLELEFLESLLPHQKVISAKRNKRNKNRK